MIKEFIEQPSKRELIRDVFKSNVKDLCDNVRQRHNAFACSYGINVMDDKASVYIDLSVNGKIYYSIVRENLHRITVEYGIKVKKGETYTYLTRVPKNFEEYMICSDLTTRALKSFYEVLELGKIRRNDD